MCREAPLGGICIKFCVTGPLVDVINRAKFYLNRVRGFDSMGVEFFWIAHKKEKSPLTQGLNYRSTCDDNDGDAVCSDAVVQSDGSTKQTCYHLVFTADSWSVANRQCASRGAGSRLAVVSAVSQNDVIKHLLQKSGLSESWLAASETVHPWQWRDGMSVRIIRLALATRQYCFQHHLFDPSLL